MIRVFKGDYIYIFITKTEGKCLYDYYIDLSNLGRILEINYHMGYGLRELRFPFA